MIFKVLPENNYLPSMLFLYRKSLFKRFLGGIFLSTDFQNVYTVHFRTNKAPDFARGIFCLQLGYSENICKKCNITD